MAEKERHANRMMNAIVFTCSLAIAGLTAWHYVRPIVAVILLALLVVGYGAYLWNQMGPLNPRRDEHESAENGDNLLPNARGSKR